jgi:uncharacterized protein (TIGR03492 family)
LRLLCLSNGHGEDLIATRILSQIQQLRPEIHLAALPLVGEGHAYQSLGVEPIGTVRAMPSGGFIYMDHQQLAKDVKGGLLQLTGQQISAVRTWAKAGRATKTQAASPSAILAVGDIVPLTFAWLSGLPYSFVGTAKSEYYIRDEGGLLPRASRREKFEAWSGSIYLPWERWLMQRSQFRGLYPRDRLTHQIIEPFGIRSYDLGNPMMDDLAPRYPELLAQKPTDETGPLVVLLLPGSRSPEAYDNWERLLKAVLSLMWEFRDQELLLLAAIAPSLDPEKLLETLHQAGWRDRPSSHPLAQLPDTIAVGQKQSTLLIQTQAFGDYLHWSDVAIATAGTATEQFVGLGKPVVSLPGAGPQFTDRFAEAQTRLLGPAVKVVKKPEQVAEAIHELLRDPDRIQLIGEIGQTRMGKPGAARRIAENLLETL